MSYQRNFCEELKKIIDKNEVIRKAGNVEVFVEDKEDPAQKVKAALAKSGVLVMVATTGHIRKIGVGGETVGDLTFEITCFENPKLNRARNKNAFTLVQAAEVIKDALHGRNLLGSKIRYIDMSRADADEHDYREIVTFAAFTDLTQNDRVVWGIGEMTRWGEITQRKFSRGGNAIFEPVRDGYTRFIGVRDPHWIVDLTCEMPTRITREELPNLGEMFTYTEMNFVTTDAEVVSSGDDSSTVRLAGRTIR